LTKGVRFNVSDDITKVEHSNVTASPQVHGTCSKKSCDITCGKLPTICLKM